VTRHRFIPDRQRKYMAQLRAACQSAMEGRSVLDGPIELSIVAKYRWPQSMLKRRAGALPEWKHSVPDADNISKILKDALNPRRATGKKPALPPVVWGDDSQVVSLHVWKKYGEAPSLTVRIRAL
jgi:Holliday junction resolvase RusA-like endonuclease